MSETETQTDSRCTLGKVMVCMAELLNVFIYLIFGLPPLPFGLVLKLLK